MRNILTLLVFIFISSSSNIYGQYAQSEILPGISGEELLGKLVDEYQAQILFFSYGMSRDTMFRYVYGVNDSLSCVYSGHTVYMDPNEDPTTTVYMNGIDDGINTEHTFPQSKGAGFGNARSDMHHLYPSRAKVNEERSNFPFGEINDEETDLWFYKNQSMFTKPSSNIDEYSEWEWQTFEPRESHKGNVARAMMYFYTMYKTQADAADPEYFSSMVPTLCEWHFLDPVDSLEWARTNLIAKWQVYPNPFVLDCSLASRTYCDIVNDACALAVDVEDLTLKENLNSVYYIRENNTILVEIDLEVSADLTVNIYNVAGQLIQKKSFRNLPNGENKISLPNRNEGSGIYFVQTVIQSKEGIQSQIEKISIIN